MKLKDLKQNALEDDIPLGEDERRTREAVSDMSPGRKILWFIGYHKLILLIGCVLLALVVYACIYVSQDRAETVLYVTLVNTDCDEAEALDFTLFHDLLAEGDHDMADETESVTTMTLDMDSSTSESVYTYQTLYAQFLVGDFDIFAADADTYMAFAINDGFIDLTDYLTEDQLEKYADILFYTESQETGEIYPCGFEVGPESELGCYYSEGCVVGICVNADNLDNGWEVLLRLIEASYP